MPINQPPSRPSDVSLFLVHKHSSRDKLSPCATGEPCPTGKPAVIEARMKLLRGMHADRVALREALARAEELVREEEGELDWQYPGWRALYFFDSQIAQLETLREERTAILLKLEEMKAQTCSTVQPVYRRGD